MTPEDRPTALRAGLSRRAACRVLLGLPFLQVSLAGCTQTLSDSDLDSQRPGGAPPFARRTLEDIVGPNVSSLREVYGNAIHRVEFSGAALGRRLLQKWKAAGSGRFTIAHFGDSLLQQGGTAEMLRNRLQLARGSAGRGMVFPYKIAKTYSQNDFSSAFTGIWATANSIQSPPRIPVGVSGFVAQTTDRTASFTLSFETRPEPGAKKVRLFYLVTAAGYRARLSSGGRQWELALPLPAGGASTAHVDFNVPRLGEELSFEIRAPDWMDAVFEVHGVDIENTRHGVLHHNLGVGGANFAALLEQSYFEEQARRLAPDLVILDWGTNDIIYRNAVPPNLERTVVATIRKVRAALPNALIMLTSAQDMYFRLRPVTASWDFAVLMRRLAAENDCLFYDWYRAAGGRYSMLVWYAYELAGADHVHLSSRGYAIKGDLMAQALLNTIKALEANPRLDGISVRPMRDENAASVSAWLKATKPSRPRPPLVGASSRTRVVRPPAKKPRR